MFVRPFSLKPRRSALAFDKFVSYDAQLVMPVDPGLRITPGRTRVEYIPKLPFSDIGNALITVCQGHTVQAPYFRGASLKLLQAAYSARGRGTRIMCWHLDAVFCASRTLAG